MMRSFNLPIFRPKHQDRILFTIIYVFVSQALFAQELLPFQNFPPNIYHADTQNWCITQSPTKQIYIANNKGLLAYNGATWNTYKSPNQTIIRSAKAIGNKIYTGCYMNFGYWTQNSDLTLHYTSLSDKIRNKLLLDEQFWKIIGNNRWILFQSLHRIYVYDCHSNKFNIITSDTSLPKAFEVNNKIYFQKMGRGIYILDSDGRIRLLTDNPILQKNIVINIYPDKDKFLFQTQESGFYSFSQGTVKEWNIAASPLLKSLSIYCSIRLKDGSYALGTIGNGLYVLSPDGHIKAHLDKKNGLQNNTILTLFQDIDENIWMGLDNGITIMNYASPFREYFDAKGMFGTVYAAASYNGLLYIGTNQGLFYRPLNSDVDFKQIAGMYGQVWTLKTIDKTLFCGHNAGTFIINGNRALRISDVLGTWEIKPIENNSNLLIQGNYEGLHILEKTNGSWHYRNKIYGFDISSRYFELLPGNKIFVNHEYKGVYELFYTPDFKKIVSWHKVPSAPKCYNSGMIKYENRLLYLCNKGVFEYNQPRNQFLKNEILTSYILQGDMYLSGKLLVDEKQALWAFTGENILHLSAGGIGRESQINRISLPMALRENVAGFENLIYLSDKEYLLGTTNGYIIFNLGKVNEKNYHIAINSIEKSELNQKGTLIPQSEDTYKLKHGENNLSFSFSVPNYDRFSQTSYQYKLEGLDNTWGEWSKDPVAIFKNLPPGNYTFNVRAKVGNKLSANIASFHFRIAQVWYLSIWMIFSYIILLIFIIYRINLIYKKKYIEDKNKIELEQQKELTLIQLENDRTIINLRNEKLSTEVDAKNRELVSTTMAIVKKNELLNNIKTELLQEKNSPFVKSALQIINNDLENNNDWKAFQEAFDNIDRDFLKKLKDLHCALTPNDLKLCVYLRMNLSSKEIAPLLNISPQSVEIKRFRLRKKIGLDHEQNLAEYILNL